MVTNPRSLFETKVLFLHQLEAREEKGELYWPFPFDHILKLKSAEEIENWFGIFTGSLKDQFNNAFQCGATEAAVEYWYWFNKALEKLRDEMKVGDNEAAKTFHNQLEQVTTSIHIWLENPTLSLSSHLEESFVNLERMDTE